MPKTPWATVQDVTPQDTLPRGHPFESIPDGLLEVQNVLAGMVTRQPRDQTPPESSRDLSNARIRDYWCGRRPGTEIFGPTKPDSDQVNRVVTFVREDGQIFLCRITDTFHVSDGANWVEYDVLDDQGNPATLPIDVRISIAQAFDDLYLADGTNPVWRVDFSSQTVQQIEGAPTAKYITTFAERIIAGNIARKTGGIRPNAFMWPVNANPLDWEGLGSGFEDMAETDIGNHITNVIGFEAQMIILRRKSIVHVTRQPFALHPFRTREFISGLGCDLPHTAVKIPNGIIFADQRTRDVYYYSPGNRPQPIASNVNRDILSDLDRLSFAEGAYDPYEGEYHLGIIPDGETQITKTWVFNITRGAWTYDPEPTVSTIGSVSVPGSYTIIDDLLLGEVPPDDEIDDLTGIIDSYGSEGEFKPSLAKGLSTGEIIRYTYDAANEHDGTAFEFIFESPNIGSISRRRTLKEIIAAIEAGAVGVYNIEHAVEENTWRNTKTITLSSTGKQRIQLKTQITGDDIYWRVRSTAPQFKLLNWVAKVLDKGLQHA